MIDLVKKNFIIYVVIVAVVLAFFFYLARDQEVIHEDNEQIKIGLSFDSIVVERWQREMEIFIATATDYGAEVIVQVANEDVNEQIKQINYLVEEKVDVLVILPNDAEALSYTVNQAKKKGIQVIAYDRLIKDSDVDLYLSFDNEKIGEALSQKLMDNLVVRDDVTTKENGSHEIKNIVIINGSPRDNNSYLLNQGYYNVLSDYMQEGTVNVVSEVWATEWRESIAKNAVEDVLEEGTEIHGIIAANDVLATGAIEVLSEWQLAGDVLVVGQDAELSACQRIVEDTQLATVYKPIGHLAKFSAETAIKMANGEEIDTEDTIDDGTYEVPYTKLDFILVDKDNIDEEIIGSGFHSEENVYMNVKREQ